MYHHWGPLTFSLNIILAVDNVINMDKYTGPQHTYVHTHTEEHAHPLPAAAVASRPWSLQAAPQADGPGKPASLSWKSCMNTIALASLCYRHGPSPYPFPSMAQLHVRASPAGWPFVSQPVWPTKLSILTCPNKHWKSPAVLLTRKWINRK